MEINEKGLWKREMNKDKENIFGLSLINIPYLNLRNEFKKNYRFIFSTGLDEYLKSPHGSIETPYGIWIASSDSLMTFILQKSILGLESYLPIALKLTANYLGRLTDTLHNEIDEAYGCKVLFKEVPKLVDPEISMHKCNAKFYDDTVKFYKLVRNPLFHGREIHNADVVSLRASFNHINEIYKWIDSWNASDRVLNAPK